MRRLIFLALLLCPAALHAQVVDSLVRYCPQGFEFFKDTVVVIPTRYELSLKQSIYLRAIQCGYQKAREVSHQPTIRWFSSDTAVLYVTYRTGRVTALKPGTATVFAVYP